ncbi:hypothetical protein BT69DRAFT_1339822 [Atractiella rhizophila]|nr:hypothetical protein BT69DRAFT_1339822 [Atractiella rhizophila]
MEVISPLSSFLSNYELLLLLHDSKSQREAAISSIRAAQQQTLSTSSNQKGVSSSEAEQEREEKEKEARIAANVLIERISPENVASVEHATISYLSNPSLPTTRQSPRLIASLLRQLEAYALTKAEKLQIVNLMPRELVDLHVIVEELDSRFGPDQIASLLALVSSHLTEHVDTTLAASSTGQAHAPAGKGVNGIGGDGGRVEVELEVDEEMEMLQQEEEFVHEGLGGEGGDGKEGRDIDEVDD